MAREGGDEIEFKTVDLVPDGRWNRFDRSIDPLNDGGGILHSRLVLAGNKAEAAGRE